MNARAHGNFVQLPTAVDVELLAKVLSNSEMAALLTPLAKTLENKKIIQMVTKLATIRKGPRSGGPFFGYRNLFH